MARSLALSFFGGGVSARAYFPTVFRSMPSFRAMARRESPCSVACCTASQRACWVSVGVRRNWWRTGFAFPPLLLVVVSSSLASFRRAILTIQPALQGPDLRAASDRGTALCGSGVPVPGGRLRHATSTGKLQLAMVLAFSEWWRNSIRERAVAGQATARAEGRFSGRRPSLSEQQREYIRVERSKGVSQRELAKLLEVSRWTIQQVDR